MEWTTIEARWPEYRVAAKLQWGKLSEEQIARTRGNREYLAKRVQEAYGMSSDDAERQINDWQARQVERSR
jgi:uncharacterized protein YjbJ (UPF0337 family)